MSRPSATLRALPAPAAPAAAATQARPFLKWAGGKTQLLAHLLARFPREYGRYHEPFLGGGAVFFALQPQRAVLSDVNSDLIATYRALQSKALYVMRALRRLPVSEEDYYQVRARDGSRMSAIQCAARVIYLNRTCYNGLYRVNQRGHFNVPFGRYTNPTICNRNNLEAVSAALKGVQIRHQSALHMGRQVRRGDLVYFDPPYHPVSSTASFAAYTRAGFGPAEQIRLAALFRRLAARGVHVVLSNSDTPFIRQLYQGCRIERVLARRSINSCATGRGRIGEVIITARA